MSENGEKNALLAAIYLASTDEERTEVVRTFNAYTRAIGQIEDTEELETAEFCASGLIVGINVEGRLQSHQNYGIIAKDRIAEGTLIGFYRGKVTAAVQQQPDVREYCIGSVHRKKRGNAPYYTISAYDIRNTLGLHLVNDNPQHHNVGFEELWNMGLPFIAFRATADIEPNEFLSLSYDDTYYWQDAPRDELLRNVVPDEDEDDAAEDAEKAAEKAAEEAAAEKAAEKAAEEAAAKKSAEKAAEEAAAKKSAEKAAEEAAAKKEEPKELIATKKCVEKVVDLPKELKIYDSFVAAKKNVPKGKYCYFKIKNEGIEEVIAVDDIGTTTYLFTEGGERQRMLKADAERYFHERKKDLTKNGASCREDVPEAMIYPTEKAIPRIRYKYEFFYHNGDVYQSKEDYQTKEVTTKLLQKRDKGVWRPSKGWGHKEKRGRWC